MKFNETLKNVLRNKKKDARAGVELSVIIPTYNEKENIKPLLKKLDAALDGIQWEVVFVEDDSPDGTAEVIKEFFRKIQRIRCLKRVGRRGLSSACIEGIQASAVDYVAVMDADHQHDETLLKRNALCIEE